MSKSLPFRLLLLLALALGAAWSARPALASPPPLVVAAKQPAPPAYQAEDQPLRLKDYDEPRPAPREPWWQQILGFLFKLALVIGLIVLGLSLFKRLSSTNLALSNTRGRNLVVLESAHVTPQQALHLISLGGSRLLVVGSSPQGLTTLAEITDPQQVAPFLQGRKGNPSAFNQAFDLESVVQEANSDLLNETLREVQGPVRREWPRR